MNSRCWGSLVLLSLLLLPASTALDVQVADQARGSGDGQLRGPMDRFDVALTSFTKPGTILRAHKIVLTEYEGLGAEVGLAGTIRPSHERHKPIERWTFHEASLMLLRPWPGASLVLAHNGTTEATLDAKAQFRIDPPGSIDDQSYGTGQDPYAPGYRFNRRDPASLRVTQSFPQLGIRGDFSIKVSDLTFCLEQGGVHSEFRAFKQRAGSDSTPSVEFTNETFYVLDVFGGTLELGAYARSLTAYMPRLTVDVTGVLEILGDEYRDLRGEVYADARAVGDDRFQVSYVTRPPDARSEAEAVRPETGPGVPWLASGLLALALVGSTAWGVRGHLRQRAPSVGKPVPEALPAQPPSGGLQATEANFRRDPSNVLLGLELGIAYHKAGRTEEALPLLLLATQAYPKTDVARYHAGLALLEIGRADEGVKHLHYAFRLNQVNVARFLKEGPAAQHGRHPLVRELIARWARVFHDAQHRGYA